MDRNTGSGAVIQKPRTPECLVGGAKPGCTPGRALLGASSVAEPGLIRPQQHGLTFENAFMNACMCSPARSTPMSGYFPAQHGVKYTLDTVMPAPQYPQVGLATTFTNPPRSWPAGYTPVDKRTAAAQGQPFFMPATANEDLSTKPSVQAEFLVRILDTLPSTRPLENTLVIATAGHGRDGQHARGMRQKNFNLYEESIRVPLVYSNPRLFKKAQTTDARVSHGSISCRRSPASSMRRRAPAPPGRELITPSRS